VPQAGQRPSGAVPKARRMTVSPSSVTCSIAIGESASLGSIVATSSQGGSPAATSMPAPHTLRQSHYNAARPHRALHLRPPLRPAAFAARIAPIAWSSSSGVNTSPVWSTRSRTAKQSWRGTSGGGRWANQSYSLGRS
jgi:hypothetical protein